MPIFVRVAEIHFWLSNRSIGLLVWGLFALLWYHTATGMEPWHIGE